MQGHHSKFGWLLLIPLLRLTLVETEAVPSLLCHSRDQLPCKCLDEGHSQVIWHVLQFSQVTPTYRQVQFYVTCFMEHTCKFGGLTPDLLNQKLWGWGPIDLHIDKISRCRMHTEFENYWATQKQGGWLWVLVGSSEVVGLPAFCCPWSDSRHSLIK